VSERLQEVNDVKAALAEAQNSLQKKEADIARIHKMVSSFVFGC
jgi:septal ring factor EnvC (AmiA/AmiB activator)